MQLKDILIRERKKRGWSQEELAERVQVSRQAVSKWETGDALPDLAKCMALADALELSLDVLCGRETPAAQAAESGTAPKRQSRLWCAVSIVLALCLLAGAAWGVSFFSQRDVTIAEEARAESTLPDNFTVSGVIFSGKSDDELAYSFTPSASGETYSYQITFSDTSGQSYTFDAPYSGGVCAGTANIPGYESYTVTVSVSDDTGSRNMAIAGDLHFSKTGASWIPCE